MFAVVIAFVCFITLSVFCHRGLFWGERQTRQSVSHRRDPGPFKKYRHTRFSIWRNAWY